jgi:hypothetical protein
MTVQEKLEERALADYQEVKGKLVQISQIYGYLDDEDWEGPVDSTVIVRVTDTPENEIRRWRDDWLDPIYDVEIVTSGTLPDGLRSCWIHGKSYNLSGAETPGWVTHVGGDQFKKVS